MGQSEQTAKEIFLGALERADVAERRRYLDDACGADAVLRRRVEALLAAFEASGSPLDHPAAGGEFQPTAVYDTIAERPGTTIGPYRLMEQIGQGGFGLVFVAEQQHPVRRKVALKVIKPGMDTGHVIARFEAERQALALMDHPNIAKVLDAGATESGRPYFVMELVKGVPITEYCDQHQLSPRERLELFISVCHAVQHAHQKGIIHRDIKPSNVLVTLHDGRPVVKVIDFGVAKALHQQLTERTIYTQFAQMIGTPLYMSPEQAEMSGLDIDTRSDIYSLGVLLYELLTGSTPFDRKRLSQAAFDELRRIIREEEPPRPSTRLTQTTDALPSVAAQRRMEPAKLSKLVRGDLDWITMKALEKDRTRRYETATGFAADIQRYLDDEPVEACPPTATYRMRKLARRHRWALSTVGGFVALLVIGAAVSSWLAIRATDAERRAQLERNFALEARDDAEKSQLRSQEMLREVQMANVEAQRAQERSHNAMQELKSANENAEQSARAAREQAAAARRNLYAAQLNLIQAAWETDNISQVLSLLDQQRPSAGEPDRRGFEWHYWNRMAHAELSSRQLAPAGTFAKLGRPILNADGTLAAVLCVMEDNAGYRVSIWDVPAGRQRASVVIDDLYQVEAFSPDNGQLALFRLGADDEKFDLGEVKVLKIPTGEIVFRATLEAFNATKSRFSPDGKLLAKVGNQTLKVWDLQTGSERYSLPANGMVTDALAFSPDGKWLAAHFLSRQAEESADAPDRVDDAALLLDLETGNSIAVAGLNGALGRLFFSSLDRSLTFSPDSTRVALVPDALSSDPGLVIAAIAEESQFLRITEQTYGIDWVTFSPDGKLIAGYGRHPTIKIWDASTGALRHLFKGHAQRVNSAAFSRDGNRLISVDDRRVIKEWNVVDPLPPMINLTRRSDSPSTVSADGSRLALAGNPVGSDSKTSENQHRLQIYDVTQQLLAEQNLPNGVVTRLQFSPDGKRLACCLQRHEEGSERSAFEVTVWSVDPLRELAPMGGSRETTCYDFDFSPDGSRLCVLWDDVVTLHNAATGNLLASVGNDDPHWDTLNKGFRYPGASSVAFAAQGNEIIVALARGTDDRPAGTVVTAWDVQLKKLLWKRNAPKTPTCRLAVDQPGNRVALGFQESPSDSDVIVFDTATGERVVELRGHVGAVNALGFSPDGRRLATSATPDDLHLDGSVRIWDLETKIELVRWKKDNSQQEVLQFSPDGNRLILGLKDGYPRFIRYFDATPLLEPAR